MKKVDKYVFFWGGFLSQWEPSKFTDSTGLEYNCAEQFMMACKARLMHDRTTLEKIMNSDDPSQQKRFGRSIKNFDAKLWDVYKVSAVVEGNTYKFNQNPMMKERLLQYRTEIFVEASPKDKVWGIGKHEDSITAHTYTPEFWDGQNLLGYSLTLVRDKLIGMSGNPDIPQYFTKMLMIRR